MIAAQADLAEQLASLRRATTDEPDGELVAQCEKQLGALTALLQNVATSGPAALAAMRAEVKSSVAAALSVSQQARLAAQPGAGANAELIAATSAVVRNEVAALHADLFGRRIFDPFLRFSSDEAAEAYRQREEANRRYIEQQLAAKSPEGDLNASGATMGQMLDAHAHGAGESPEFLPRWTRLVETTRRHRDALRADGRPTKEFDDNLANSVRRYLREKGLSEAEIDAKLALAAGPLQVVQPYLRTDQDAQDLGNAMLTAQRHMDMLSTLRVTQEVMLTPLEVADSQPSKPEMHSEVGLADVLATLRTAGVTQSKARDSEALPRGVAHVEGHVATPPGASTR